MARGASFRSLAALRSCGDQRGLVRAEGYRGTCGLIAVLGEKEAVVCFEAPREGAEHAVTC